VAVLLPANGLLSVQCEIVCGMKPVWLSKRTERRYILSLISAQ